MEYNKHNLIPYILPSEYDAIATEFLEQYYPDALVKPTRVPIEQIAQDEMGLTVQYVQLTEEMDIYGMTVFSDGKVTIYNPDEGIYETQFYKKKSVLIDPAAVKKTNTGCKNNTIAHECVHWYKHRFYYRMQNYILPRQARVCKCRVTQISTSTKEENIMESQAIGIAPRILMPKEPFVDASMQLGIAYGKDNWSAICRLAEFYEVSKQSVKIRLEECNIL